GRIPSARARHAREIRWSLRRARRCASGRRGRVEAEPARRHRVPVDGAGEALVRLRGVSRAEGDATPRGADEPRLRLRRPMSLAEWRKGGEGSSARTRTERRLRRLLSSTRVLTPPRPSPIPPDPLARTLSAY